MGRAILYTKPCSSFIHLKRAAKEAKRGWMHMSEAKIDHMKEKLFKPTFAHQPYLSSLQIIFIISLGFHITLERVATVMTILV